MSKKKAEIVEDDVEPMPGVPYGGDPWLYKQVIPKPVPEGHYKIVVPIGTIMPTWTMDAGFKQADELQEAHSLLQNRTEDLENIANELQSKIQDQRHVALKYEEQVQFLSKLLNDNKSDDDLTKKTLEKKKGELQKRLLSAENKYTATKQECDAEIEEYTNRQELVLGGHQKRLKDEVSAERDHQLVSLNAELMDLQKFQTDRQRMQVELNELREAIFEREQKHKREKMAADEKRRRHHFKAQSDIEATLRQMAQEGHRAAKSNIARQTKGAEEETEQMMKNFNRLLSEVRQLKIMQGCLQEQLSQSMLEHDALVDACGAKLRESTELENRVETLELANAKILSEGTKIKKAVEEDWRSLFNSTQHAFYFNDKDVIRLEALLESRNGMLKKSKVRAAKPLENHELVERFMATTLARLKEEKVQALGRERLANEKEYQTQLKKAYQSDAPYPNLNALTNVRVNKVLTGFNPNPVGNHDDISQLSWTDKETVVELLFNYLSKYKSIPFWNGYGRRAYKGRPTDPDLDRFAALEDLDNVILLGTKWYRPTVGPSSAISQPSSLQYV